MKQKNKIDMWPMNAWQFLENLKLGTQNSWQTITLRIKAISKLKSIYDAI